MENNTEQDKSPKGRYFLLSCPAKLATKLTSKMSISYKIATCFCCLGILLLTTFWLLSKTELQNTLQQQTDGLSQTLAEQIASSIQELVLTNDLLGLNVVLNQFIDNNHILRISVYNIDEQVISSAENRSVGYSSTQNDSIISVIYIAPITLQDSIIGGVQLQLDTSLLQLNMKKTQLLFWITLGLGLLLTITLSITLTTHIVAPLREIETAISNPFDNTLSFEANQSDEITLLQNNCFNLLEQYKHNYYELQRFTDVNPLNRESSKNNSAAKVMVSILVVKVVKINTAIELLHPSTLSELLSEYLYYLNQAGQLYRGKLHQVSGEHAIVVFNSPSRKPTTSASNLDQPNIYNHSFNAICCAQLFINLMKKVTTKHKANASQALTFKHSIHSGDVFIADKQYEPQAENQQSQYILGKTIETSYFLCEECLYGELIISESTYSQARNEADLAVETGREISMPEDNLSFMSYILATENINYVPLLDEQTQQTLS